MRAQELVSQLDDDLSENSVTVDWSALLTTSASFTDELVKQLLVERRATLLSMRGASERVTFLVRRSARNRKVDDRIRDLAS